MVLTLTPPKMVSKQPPHLLWEVPTAQALRVTAPHCPPTPQAVSITPPLWEVPTQQPLWEMPTASLFPRPIGLHRQKHRQAPTPWPRSPKPKGRSRVKKGQRSPLPTFPIRHRPQGPTPRTKVLLDRSGPVGNRQGVVSPATKPAGDLPQRLSSAKWWRPLFFSGTLEGSGQTEEILTS